MKVSVICDWMIALGVGGQVKKDYDHVCAIRINKQSVKWPDVLNIIVNNNLHSIVKLNKS